MISKIQSLSSNSSETGRRKVMKSRKTFWQVNFHVLGHVTLVIPRELLLLFSDKKTEAQG